MEKLIKWPKGLEGTDVVCLSYAEEPHLGLSIWNLRAKRTVRVERETAFVLLNGHLSGEVIGHKKFSSGHRHSVFDEQPWTLHVPAGAELVLEADEKAPAELGVAEAVSSAVFEPRIYSQNQVRVEQRGQGSLHEAAHREVRTVFDDQNGPPGAALVVGEVVTFPGRWSSYPPHHHNQPELYHYRFTQPRGYGHAELSDAVYKVEEGDTLVIAPGDTHAQCAAPGYGMWYLWVIRHLEGDRYSSPEFHPDHTWTLDPKASYWWPKLGGAGV